MDNVHSAIRCSYRATVEGTSCESELGRLAALTRLDRNRPDHAGPSRVYWSKILDTHLYTTSKSAQLEARVLKDAYKALSDNTNWSQSVVFISAYYGVDFAAQLFEFCTKKRTRQITLIFAYVANCNQYYQIAELKKLRDLLKKSGHVAKRIDIRVATDITFLHTKIYAFTGPSGHKRYLLGSANFSSAAFSTNDEVLILEKGRHAGLEAYIEYVTKNSRSIDAPITTQDIKDWKSFFREGFLYFKPSRQIPYTVNCFAQKGFEKTLELLEEATKGKELQFHDAGGIGSLNLAKLMRCMPIDKETPHGRVSISSYGIETAFGHWVPSAYVKIVEEKILSSSKVRHLKLKEQGNELSGVSREFKDTQIAFYISEINKYLEPKHLTQDKKQKIKDRIHTHLKRLVGALTDQGSLKRLSRPLIGVPVPEFWEDELSGNELFDTFTEYVAYKLSMSIGMKRKSNIISYLAQRFDLMSDDDAPAVRKKIEEFFSHNNTWRVNDWPLAINDEDDDD